MSTLVRVMRNDRASRVIDWTVFVFGAGSLALALSVTVAAALA